MSKWPPWQNRQEPTLTIPQPEKVGLMSDTSSPIPTIPTPDIVPPAAVSAAIPAAAPAQPASAAAEEPLDLGQFPMTSPDGDIQMRMSLLVLAGQLTQLMGHKRIVPETLAKQTGVSESALYSIMTGREPDVGVRTLTLLANALGAPFMFGLRPPGTPAKTA